MPVDRGGGGRRLGVNSIGVVLLSPQVAIGNEKPRCRKVELSDRLRQTHGKIEKPRRKF